MHDSIKKINNQSVLKRKCKQKKKQKNVLARTKNYAFKQYQ